jgi:hypothetical protein
MALSGIPLAMPLATVDFIKDQQDAMLRSQARQLFEEHFGRDHVTALALNRLQNNRGHFFRRQSGPEKLLFNRAHAIHSVILGRCTFRTPVGIGKLHMKDAGHQRPESLALNYFATG